MKQWHTCLIFVFLSTVCLINGCTEKKLTTLPINGVLEENIITPKAPEIVHQSLQTTTIDERFEELFNDNVIGVWSLVQCNKETSSDGYGIVVKHKQTTTVFPDLFHGKNPTAQYDSSCGNLWLTCGIMEGTCANVEQLYLIKFDDNGTAHIVKTIQPYDIQQDFSQHINYYTKENQIVLYIDSLPVDTIICTIDDMGGFNEQAVWIGEQMQFNFNEYPTVLVTPGISFNVGKILLYDNMPTFAGTLHFSDTSYSISDIQIFRKPKQTYHFNYVGQYLDTEFNEPNLQIYQKNNGQYAVQIGIPRLTQISDGVGTLTSEGLTFTATDASGNPIDGIVKMNADTANVIFTSSTWEYLSNGDSFSYVLQKESSKIISWINDIYSIVAGGNYNSDSLAAHFCSTDWNGTLQKIHILDHKTNAGGVGFFDFDYWIMAQDFDNVHIDEIRIEDLESPSPHVFFDLHNFGTVTHIQLDICKEDGFWKINNFLNVGAEYKDWKHAMKQYLTSK